MLKDNWDLKQPSGVLDSIWRSFAEDRKKNRATAYVNLQQAFANHHDDIVPKYSTEKEYMAMIADIEQWTKSDQQSDSGDPMQICSAWLRGEVDLSRVRLEKAFEKLQ
jgi:hypothetical protein